MNILLVEDNPADMRLVSEALAEHAVSAELHWVQDGQSALDFLRRAGAHGEAPVPDLVFLDLNLPGIGGKEVLGEIKNDPHLCSVPIVVLTSSAARQDVLDAYRLHCNSYLVKPVDFDEYLALVEHIRSYWLDVALLPTRAV